MKWLLKRKKLGFLVIGGIIVGLGFGWYRFSTNSLEVLKVTPSVEVVKKTVSASGAIQAKVSADLAFTLLGKVAKVYVKPGDIVKAHQLLAQLENSELAYSVQAAKDARDIALRDLDLYVENYDDNRDAVGGSDEYLIGVRRLNELVSKAQAAYSSEQATFNKSFIYAPFSGTVLDVVDENVTLGVGTAAVTLADLADLIFEAKIDQEDFGQVNLGKAVEVALDAYPDTFFDGSVEDLPYLLASGATEFVVKISLVPKQDKRIVVGMQGDARIVVAQTEGAVTALPFDAIFSDKGASFIWISKNGRLSKQPVELGLEGDLVTEIKTDLSNLEVVVPKTEADAKSFTEALKIKISN